MHLKHRGTQTRYFNVKDHAIAFGRNLAAKAVHAYNTGKHVANTIDRGYHMIKRLHAGFEKSLEKGTPEMNALAKKAFSGYEAVRTAVQDVDTAGQKLARSMG